MGKRRGWLAILLALTLCMGSAGAEAYVSILELRVEAEQSGEPMLIPDIDRVPILTVSAVEQKWNETAGAEIKSEETGIRVSVGTFDESVSGGFLESVRQGRRPSHTELTNGLTLEQAQSLLDKELHALAGQSLNDYGLIWTEIASWENMETWLFNYGKKYQGLTLFSDQLTFDARGEQSYLILIPNAMEERIVYEDVPLADLAVLEASVEAFEKSHSIKEIQGIELGYLPYAQGNETLLMPVWRMDFVTGRGYDCRYFSAQTGEPLAFNSKTGLYDLPEALTWNMVK